MYNTFKKEKDENWSSKVTKESDALDLEKDVFTRDDPEEIARSLKRSAEASKRRKSGSFQSAMSMLNFYINRAGKKLNPEHRTILEKAKQELRKVYGRKES